MTVHLMQMLQNIGIKKVCFVLYFMSPNNIKLHLNMIVWQVSFFFYSVYKKKLEKFESEMAQKYWLF